jgi:hypothetical protein
MRCAGLLALIALLVAATGVRAMPGDDDAGRLFRERVAPILEARCLSCHGDGEPKGGFSLASQKSAFAGGASGPAIVPGKPDDSLLIGYISGDDPEMPKAAPPLSAGEVAAICDWISAGATWPNGLILKDKTKTGPWWSLAPLVQPDVPAIDSPWIRTPIDAFVLARLNELGLRPALAADRRTLLRRLTFDLHGLPPAPAEVDAFLTDERPDAYERLVDSLLASPRYGERWGRYWLDIVHFGESHGYDKDKPRSNAWPYRDYVIRALNDDKPYSRFVLEQLAGDVLWPDDPQAVSATGFVAAGPWDFVGHTELREGTVDKLIARSNDRDDMVMTAMSTFASMTVHCARCHDHKFDPVTQEDYYRLQAVFAGVDRGDRPYPDPELSHKRQMLVREREAAAAEQARLEESRAALTSTELVQLDQRTAAVTEQLAAMPDPFCQDGEPTSPTNGYHSAISSTAAASKWVQVDLGRSLPIDRIRLVPARPTDFRDTPGFGFPLRFKISISDDATFSHEDTVADKSEDDYRNPHDRPFAVHVRDRSARYVRVTASKLWPRTNDYVFALAEALEAERVRGHARRRLVLFRLVRAQIVDRLVPAELKDELARAAARLTDLDKQIEALPKEKAVYALKSIEPRPIHLLRRGDVKSPGPLVTPGALACLSALPHEFGIADSSDEGSRRVALARWIVDPANVLARRSIVNRVWQYHFGVGLVDTPNDFGRMGSLPSHPQLLDWLAAEFFAQGESLKELHKLIVTSSAYRQSSDDDPTCAKIDAANRYLWRQNRRRLDAEAIHDSVLAVSGKLDLAMGGPSVRQFAFKDDHSPIYDYAGFDVDDPAACRRSVYRFIVRSVPDPLMECLDCADPSLLTPRRNTTLTVLQSLAMLNNALFVRQAEHFAQRVRQMADEPREQITAAYRLALSRPPRDDELQLLVDYAAQYGLASACRLILNSNEFAFVD